MWKTDIILMAAGDSRRYGTENKLFRMIDGKPMFSYAVDTAVQVMQELGTLAGEIAVISKYEEIEAYVRKIPYHDIFYRKNEHSERGISESIRIGVRETDRTHAILFFVCDQPWMRCETLCRLIRGFAIGDKTAGAVVDDAGNVGNPCIFAPSMRQELMKLTGDRGGKNFFKQLPQQVCFFVRGEDWELHDIDTPEG